MKLENREKFKSILEDKSITQQNAAILIAEYTKRPCSVRTIRAWLNDPNKPSSRPCPDWALDALKNITKKMVKGTL